MVNEETNDEMYAVCTESESNIYCTVDNLRSSDELLAGAWAGLTTVNNVILNLTVNLTSEFELLTVDSVTYCITLKLLCNARRIVVYLYHL